jgi:hypothetical protein
LRVEGHIPYRATIAEKIGVSHHIFDDYPALKAMRKSLLSEKLALYEEQLLQKVKQAVAELEAEGQPIIRRLLEAKVGYAYNTLKRYPRVRSFWQASLTYRTLELEGE